MSRTIAIFLVMVVAAGWARAAESFIIVDDHSGAVLASDGRDDKRQIASLTKVVTAMVVMDWARVTSADLGELVTVPPAALAVGGVNSTGFQAGDMVSMRDLLYAALMASDNIAAHTLAGAVGRRLPNPQGLRAEENFVAHMNGLATELKMTRTRFANPSGLDNVDGGLPFSTAEDMARLVRYAYDRPSFPFYVSQTSREIQILRGGVPVGVWLKNTNPLLGQDGIDGVKTGRTAKAGDCIILSSTRQAETTQTGDQVALTPRRVIVVLLGTRDRSSEGAAMVQRAWQLHDRWVAEGRKMSKGQSL